jgi:hypothetical protein
MKFPQSRKKVERANEHIHDLNQRLLTFAKSDFYSVRVEEYKGENHVRIDIDKSGFDTMHAALIVGDALHNFRSALDMLYYQAMHETTGLTDQWTRFPIFNEREKLVSSIDGGLKKKGLSDDPSALAIRDVVVDVVKAYQAGNYTLWALHDMNITDKHQLIIPIFDLMRFTDIRLQDERNEVFLANGQPYFTEESYRFKAGRKGKLTVKDKGNAAIAIVFNAGIPFKDKPVIQGLREIAESLTRTIDAFEALDLRVLFE